MFHKKINNFPYVSYIIDIIKDLKRLFVIRFRIAADLADDTFQFGRAFGRSNQFSHAFTFFRLEFTKSFSLILSTGNDGVKFILIGITFDKN